MTILRVSWKVPSSFMRGNAARTSSAMTLCSRMNRVWKEVSKGFSLTRVSPDRNIPRASRMGRLLADVFSLPRQNERNESETFLLVP